MYRIISLGGMLALLAAAGATTTVKTFQFSPPDGGAASQTDRKRMTRRNAAKMYFPVRGILFYLSLYVCTALTLNSRQRAAIYVDGLHFPH